MTTKPLYEYADGNANLYLLEGTNLEYIPVKPEESSTGMYSGGNPKTVQLTQAQADSILSLIGEAINNKSVLIEDRIKGSGAIRIGQGRERKQFILVPGCQEIRVIEDALKRLLN